ncbi:pentatricopeptide repeat-containing protein, partial [Trifolium medium]|nr:pentatricopeptide repeat-containing protein [Trifolium medium]
MYWMMGVIQLTSSAMTCTEAEAVLGAEIASCNHSFIVAWLFSKVLIKLDPDLGGRHIHLESIHAAAGEWNRMVQ